MLRCNDFLRITKHASTCQAIGRRDRASAGTTAQDRR